MVTGRAIDSESREQVMCQQEVGLELPVVEPMVHKTATILR